MTIVLCILMLVCLRITSCRYHVGSDREESKETRLREITDDLYNVFSLGDRKAWVVGYYGSIYCTDDGGAVWKKQPSGTRESLYGIHFVNDRQGWICGSYGTLLATEDGGKSWILQESGTDKHLFDIHFVDPLLGMAVGYYGAIVRTQDGGRSWQNVSLEEDMSLNALDLVDSSTGWAVGEFAAVLRTDDFGTTWTRQKVPAEEVSLFGVDFASRTLGYVTGMDGVIFKTDDGGNVWVPQESHAKDSIFSIQIAGDQVWAVGLKGTALFAGTSDAGWEAIPELNGVWAWLRAVHFNGSKGGWIVGSKGTMFKSTNGGTWNEIIF